jgi:hypothetical protein
MKQSWWDWNNAIGRATFSKEQVNRVVYLAVDKDEIGRIGRNFDLDAYAAYESFRSAVITQVRDGWPEPSKPIQEGQYPHYLAVLAAQVVAAFQMHDDGLTGAKAYWRRLREFLGQSSEDKRPDGLKNCRHQDLWKGLKRWANETNHGHWGRVRLVEKSKGHHLVAEPLGQCLLRRADLVKLQGLFAENGRPDTKPYTGRRLREMVDDARCSVPVRFFTKHSLRVLEDPDRRDAAWGQVCAEYKRFLADECRVAGTMKRGSITARRWNNPRTTVRLQIGWRGLSGGLYRRGDSCLTSIITEISEVLWRCYLRAGREGSKPPHKPPHEDFLLATRDDEHDPFVERKKCRAGDDVLLLIPEVPESWSQSWCDDADFCLFVAAPARYRSSIQSHRPGWEPLQGLPAGWLALRFKTREDLSAVKLRGKWIGAVDRATRLRAVGGLTLRRGVWMLGAGPKIQVVGPGSFDHLIVDGERHPLDDTRCATLDFAVGKHRVRLPDTGSRTLKFSVQKPRRAAPLELASWHRAECGWPASGGERRRIKEITGSDTLHGARLSGHWPARDESDPGLDVQPPPTANGAVPDELAAMILALRLRAGDRLSPPDPQRLSGGITVSARGINPLIRAMLRASKSGVARSTKKV